jgi:hypothetical protein
VGKLEDGVRLLKAKTSVLHNLRDTFQSFARAMIGRSGC